MIFDSDRHKNYFRPLPDQYLSCEELERILEFLRYER